MPANAVGRPNVTVPGSAVNRPAVSTPTSGIMTFVVDQDAVVFQKDLGKETVAAAATMTRLDPDLTWARVDATNY